MRPRIVNFLADVFNTNYVNYFVPTGSIIYVAVIITVAWLFIHRCRNIGLPKNIAFGAILVGILGAMVGARLFYLILHIETTFEHPHSILRFGGGTVSWGGYLGGFAAFLLYLRKEQKHRLEYLDILASVLGIGPFIGRWACFLNGCCYGTPTALPWGVRFPQNSFAYNSHLRQGSIDAQSILSLSVHPVQIYASILSIIIFFITSYYCRKYRKVQGATFLFYWIIYGTVRFFIEFLRGDGLRYTDLNLTLSQIIIILLLPISSLGIAYIFRTQK